MSANDQTRATERNDAQHEILECTGEHTITEIRGGEGRVTETAPVHTIDPSRTFSLAYLDRQAEFEAGS